MEEYHKELEVVMIRANVIEDEEVTMSRFFSGLNKYIANVVELQPYMDLEDLINLSIKVEKQMIRKSSARLGAYSCASLGWKMNYRREGNAPSKPIMTPKVVEPSNPKKQVLATKQKSKTKVKMKHNRDIKCFKCQGLGHYASRCANQRIMIFRDDGEIEFTSETSNCDDMPPLMDDNDVEYAHNRENIFNTRC